MRASRVHRRVRLSEAAQRNTLSHKCTGGARQTAPAERPRPHLLRVNSNDACAHAACCPRSGAARHRFRLEGHILWVEAQARGQALRHDDEHAVGGQPTGAGKEQRVHVQALHHGMMSTQWGNSLAGQEGGG